jgi:hypothetical protein
MHSGQRLLSVSSYRSGISCLLAAAVLVAVAGGAFGQDDNAKFSSWAKVEAASETKAYKEAMSGGGAFDATARGFLEQIALPQLQLESNRPTIERIRKRLREFLLGGIANEKSADEATKTVSVFMESLAARNDADPVSRVNAMLLIGELQSPDRKPWPPAAATLAQAVANADLPKAVRIAACVGLAKHVEATRGVVEEQQRLAAVAVPAIVAILKEPTTPETVAQNDWMASRCLSMLPLLGPMKLATAEDVVRLLNDGSRSINVRVRAAAALAAGADAESKIDATALIQSIGGLAVSSLEGDVAAGDKLLLERQYGGGSGPSLPGAGGFVSPEEMPTYAPPVDLTGRPPVDQVIPREVCRRAAWRLSVLADSILADDSKRGLALLVGDIPPAASGLAQSLRRAALELDARPEEVILRQTFASMKPAAAAGGNPPFALSRHL